MTQENFITKLPSRSVSLIDTDLYKKLSYFGSTDTLVKLVKLSLGVGQNIIVSEDLESKDYVEILRSSLESAGLKLFKTDQRLVSSRLRLDSRMFNDLLYSQCALMFEHSAVRTAKYVSSEALQYFDELTFTEVKPLKDADSRVASLFKINVSDSLLQAAQLATQIPAAQPAAQPAANQPYVVEGGLSPAERAAAAARYQDEVIAAALAVRDSQPIYQMSQINKNNDLEMLKTTEYKGGQGQFPIINYDDSLNAFADEDARLSHFDMFCNPKELEKARKARPDAVRSVIDTSELDGVYREYNPDYCQVDFRDLILTNYLREGFEREDTEFRQMSIEIMRAMTEIFRTYDLVGVFYSKIYNEMLMNFKQSINFQSLFDTVTNYMYTNTDRFPVWGGFAEELVENNEADGLNPPTKDDLEFYILNYRAAFIYVVNMILEGHYKPSIVDPTATDVPDVHGIFTEILMAMTADATADKKLDYEKIYEIYLDDQFDRLVLKFGERGMSCYPHFRHFVPFNQIEENGSINIGIMVPIYAFNGNDRYLRAISRYKNSLEDLLAKEKA